LGTRGFTTGRHGKPEMISVARRAWVPFSCAMLEEAANRVGDYGGSALHIVHGLAIVLMDRFPIRTASARACPG
jgi:hypothetical protein